MASLGPFEKSPRLAVAVSGGADSMALVLLADRWARARGGEAIALTVDHRLRAASSSEALQVARWLAEHGIACRRLIWRRPAGRPTSALQAKAREARYRLLLDWCRRHSILHLALAHHAGDQAETVVMRLARGGLDGLAGMPAVASRDGVRLIRPLLAVAPHRLQSTLLAAGQPWIEDPSNRDEAYERVRWRKRIAPGLAPAIAAATAEIGQERRRREQAVADLLADARVHATGFVVLPLDVLRTAAPDIAIKALGRMLVTVGGDPYPPASGGAAPFAGRAVKQWQGSNPGRLLGSRKNRSAHGLPRAGRRHRALFGRCRGAPALGWPIRSRDSICRPGCPAGRSGLGQAIARGTKASGSAGSGAIVALPSAGA